MTKLLVLNQEDQEQLRTLSSYFQRPVLVAVTSAFYKIPLYFDLPPIFVEIGFHYMLGPEKPMA